MAPLSYKALLALAISMLASKSNAAPYVYTTSATTSSADWVTGTMPLSEFFDDLYFPTGTADPSVIYYDPQGYDAYTSSSTSSTSSTLSSTTSTTSSIPTTMVTSTSTSSSSYRRVTLSNTSSTSDSTTTSTTTSSSSFTPSTSTPSTSSTAMGFTSSAPLSSTSTHTLPTYFPASSYSDQASVVSSILSDESPSIASGLSTALGSALNNPHVYFTTSADVSTFTTESEGNQLTYTETYHHLLGLEPGYVSATAGASESITTISEPAVVHTITAKASTRTINEGTHTHTVYEKPVTHIVTEAPVVHTVYEKPVVKTVVHMVYRTEKPDIRYITRRVHRHHHDHHDRETESTDSVSRTTSTLAPSAATN